MKELIGKTVIGLRVNEGESILTFDHPDGSTTSYETYGDCCSETWFADITGVSALLGGVVTAVEDVQLESVDDGRSRQEKDDFYGVKLTTDKGFVDIVFRNSSNGYYGGNIDLMTNQPPENMKAIIGDWSV